MALDTVKIPSLEQLREIADELGFTLTEPDLAAHRESLHTGGARCSRDRRHRAWHQGRGVEMALQAAGTGWPRARNSDEPGLAR